MGHPQVVYYGPLILPFLPTPGTIGIAQEALKGIGVMDSFQFHYLQRFHGGNCP